MRVCLFVCGGSVGSRHCQHDEFHLAKSFAITNRFFALHLLFFFFPFSVNVYFYFQSSFEGIYVIVEV